MRSELRRATADGVPKPSSAKYRTAKGLAIVLDIVDIFTTIGAITGIGWIAGIVIDTAFAVFLMKYVSEGFHTAYDKQSGSVMNRLQVVDQRISAARTGAARLAKAGRKVPALRKPMRQFSRRASRFTRKFRPLRKLVRRVTLNSIPVVELWPYQYFAVRDMYREHRQAYEQSQQLQQQLAEAYRAEQEEYVAFMSASVQSADTLPSA
jgi:hypothetical protein